MTFKRLIYRALIRMFEKMMRLHSFKTCRSFNLLVEKLPSSNKQCDIATIAFNNSNTIELQIQMVKKYIQGDYTYFVADNSTDKTAQEAIESLCKKNDVGYVRLPKNYLTTVIGKGSYSHGASLNWVYYRIIKKRQPYYFGFIDHDLFPIKPISIAQKLANHPIYGHVSPPEDHWYLWAGLCFYRLNFVKDKKVDFLPAKPDKIYLDTGGGNWYSMYSKMNRSDVLIEPYITCNYETKEDWFERALNYFGDCWLHTICGSNWNNLSKQKWEQKEKMIRKIVDEIDSKI